MDRPNIVYILGDDHRGEQLGCEGHPLVETPNIDALAAQGTRFRNFFCTSPACTPSRCCHYLGQWERRHGVNFNSHSAVAPAAWEQSFPARLKAAGYCLAWVGKNHVPAGDGGYGSGYFEEWFDYWYGNHGHSGFYPKEWGGPRQTGIYHNASADTQVEVFAEGALNFLEPNPAFESRAATPLPRRPADQPFCLCVTFNLPHACGTESMQLRPTDGELYITRYRDRFGEVPIPETYVHYHDRTPRLPLDVYNGVYLTSYDYVRYPVALRERRIREYQTITGMDRMIGQLRESLERLGVADNTVIVFSTDHGIHHGEHGLGGKCFLYEEDLRIPCVVYDPRQPAAPDCDATCAVPDLAPTVLELAGLEIPATMQGRSLAPFLRGESPSDWRQSLFVEQLMDIQNYPQSQAIRTADWKYLHYFRRTEDPRATGSFRGTLDNYQERLGATLDGSELPVYEELYDLRHDPRETTNLAATAEGRMRLDDFRAQLLEAGRQVLGEGPPATRPLGGVCL